MEYESKNIEIELVDEEEENVPTPEACPSNQSVFEGSLILQEKVDLHALRVIRDNFEEVFNRMGKKFKVQKGTSLLYYEVKDMKTAQTILDEFYKSKVKSSQVKYRYAARLTYGRRFRVTPSLQECTRPIRHAVAKDIYYDIDIKNAHPVFLLAKCREYHFDHPILEKYVEGDREGFLKSLIDAKIKVKKAEADENGETVWVDNIITTRDDAKAYVLSILNGGGRPETGYKEVDEFYARQQNFLDVFFDRHENDKYRKRAMKKQVKDGRKKNEKGSALNYWLCEVENNVLTAMEEYFQLHNITYGTLCFDGLMVYKDSIKGDLNKILRETEEFVQRRTGLQITLAQKEMDEGVNLDGLVPKDDAEVENEVQAQIDKVYLPLREEFEKHVFKINSTGEFGDVREGGVLRIRSIRELKVVYQNLTINLESKRLSFIDRWLSDAKMRTYERMDFIPTGDCPPSVYNLWVPFTCSQPYQIKNEQYAQEGRDFFLNHIKTLCNNQESVYSWFLKWMGQMLVHPEFKTRMPILISKQGAGKNTLVQLMEKMMGASKVQEETSPEEHVWGKFNDMMTNSFLVVLNEISKSQTKQAEGKIKGLITDGKITIHPKGGKAFQAKSYHRFIMLTNNNEPINIEQGDRRNVIIRCSDSLIGNKEHFTKFYKYLEDQDCVYSFYQYITSLPDLALFHTLQNEEAPISEYQEALAEVSVSPVEVFLKWLLANPDYRTDTNILSFTGPVFFDIWNDFRKRCGYEKYESTALQLMVRIKNLNIPGVEKKKTKVNNVTVLDLNKIALHYGTTLEELDNE